MYIRKEDNSLWSVLKGFVKRIPPQNKKADEFGLEQVKDGHELEHFIEEGILVYFPESSLGFRVDLGKEPPNHQYAHSWVLDFTTDFSKIHQKEIGSVLKRILKISSLTRPIAYQQAEIIRNVKSTADCEKPDQCSLHARGIAIDISKNGMPSRELLWMKNKLAKLHRADIGVDATEEGSHFHIIVFPDYRGITEVLKQ